MIRWKANVPGIKWIGKSVILGSAGLTHLRREREKGLESKEVTEPILVHYLKQKVTRHQQETTKSESFTLNWYANT